MKLKQVLPKDLLKVLFKLGFEIKRRKGSHVFIERTKDGKIFATSISIHNEPFPKGTLKGILTQSDVNEEEVIALL